MFLVNHINIIVVKNKMNPLETEKLKKLKLLIEKMNNQQQIEVLKILHGKDEVTLNENKSGIYVNLSFLPLPIIGQIEEYVTYVQDQEKSLNFIEDRKENVKQEYFDTL
tara:strand:- start:324 stop:650 length:327 start_codon:yes stop_codon:yes gene_type:complete